MECPLYGVKPPFSGLHQDRVNVPAIRCPLNERVFKEKCSIETFSVRYVEASTEDARFTIGVFKGDFFLQNISKTKLLLK